MHIFIIKNILIIITLLLPTSLFSFDNSQNQNNNWKGSAIIGNGNICAVYSDDDRTNENGIYHLYYKDFTADYISSSTVNVFNRNGTIFFGPKSIGMTDFFSTSTKTTNRSNFIETRTFSAPNDGIITSLFFNDKLKGGSFVFKFSVPNQIHTNRVISLVAADEIDNSMLLQWNNDVYILFSLHNQAGNVLLKDSILYISGKLKSSPTYISIVAANSKDECLKKTNHLQEIPDLFDHSKKYWNQWMNSGNVPKFEKDKYLEAYKKNLYCVKASSLNGQVPADITGQFVTNNMPQLYPRDAMMSARVLIKTGHLTEAAEIIRFWLNKNVPKKSKGEWYARYDAHGQAVDAGTGARYDEPEWDANAYLIQLIYSYYKFTNQWLADSVQIYETADFLVNHIDTNGLLFEGGIIEWSGYLPATNMTAAAALKTASQIADIFNNNLKSETYNNAAETISKSLVLMYDKNRNTYADVRFSGEKEPDNSSQMDIFGNKLYLWDTSANFGIIWGYPDHEFINNSNNFYLKNTVKLDGGMQYFDAPDAGLAGYGHDVFFFTTAAAAQYFALNGNFDQAKSYIDWMMQNANIYGLMPERIYLNGTDCSDASPLSWCSAEFTAALLELYIVTESK